MPLSRAQLHDRAWRLLLRAPERRTATLLVRAAAEPVEGEVLIEAGLFTPVFGVFRHVLAAPGWRRVAAIAYGPDGAPVAHVLVGTHPEGHYAAADIGAARGFSLGVAGAFVAPARRGEGLAKRCLAAVGAFLADALPPDLALSAALTSEARIVALCRGTLPFPVVARWKTEREDAIREAEHFHLVRSRLRATLAGRATRSEAA